MLQEFFHIFRNALDYPLRRLIPWKRRGLHPSNEPKDNLFRGMGEPEAEKLGQISRRLYNQYYLDYLYTHSTVKDYRINLYYLALIEQSLDSIGRHLPGCVEVADIGVSDWFYIQSLYAGIKYWRCPEGRSLQIQGYETDPYRVYRDWHSRYDHALKNIANLDQVHYFPYGFEEQPQKYDFITQFFPFVLLKDHLEWGLPLWSFTPISLLEKVWCSLKRKGILLIVNQGLQEHEEQKKLLHQIHVDDIVAFRFESSLYQYAHQHYVIVCSHD